MSYVYMFPAVTAMSAIYLLPCFCILCCRLGQPTVALEVLTDFDWFRQHFFCLPPAGSSHLAFSKDSHQENSPICEPGLKPAIMYLPSVFTALTGWTQPTLTCVCFVSFSYFGVFDSGHYPSGISHRLQQPGMNRLRDNWLDVYFIVFWLKQQVCFVSHRS